MRLVSQPLELLLVLNAMQKRGDKILIFSDNIFSLEKYAKDLKRPLIHGKTKVA